MGPDWDILYRYRIFCASLLWIHLPGSVVYNKRTDFRPGQHGLPIKDYLQKERVNENFTWIVSGLVPILIVFHKKASKTSKLFSTHLLVFCN